MHFKHSVFTFGLSALMLWASPPAISAPVIIVFPPPLLEFDAKTFSGNGCHAFSARESSEIDHYMDGVYNNSVSAGRFVSCPVVRDNTTNTNGTGRSLMVYVNNVSPPAAPKQLFCNLSSRQADGTWITSNTQYTTVDGPATLNLKVTSSAVNGYYALYCYLPPQASIRSYELYEYQQTDASN